MGILDKLNSIIWGIPTVTLILFVGVLLSLHTGFAQVKLLPDSMKALLCKFKKQGDSSSFQALCTALAATVGTGNIAGVAGAIAIGGPGSIFWMWICAVLGMITKFAEAVLAVRFRTMEENGAFSGGPMYIIDKGLGKQWHPMAISYSLLGTAAAFGVGNATQVNAAVTGVNSVISYLGKPQSLKWALLMGILLAVLAVVAPLGGAKRVGSIAELLVPVAAVAYTVLCVGALICHRNMIPYALKQIVCGAFQPRAVTGGAVGSCMLVLRIGAARGVFTNEAGMGTAALAHSTANVAHPVQQGLMGIMEVFLDTIVICTMTALVILTSGVAIPYGIDEGAQLTTRAFSATYGTWVCIPMAAFLSVFAAATILGWGFYGVQCITYLMGERGKIPFVIVQAMAAMLGALWGTANIWTVSEFLNGLMAIPNLIALLMLRNTVILLTKNFIQEGHRKQASGRNLPEGNK